MMKYDGTRVSSKKKKKRIRSSEMKLPMQAASSKSIQAMKARGFSRVRAPARTIGNRTPASSSKKSEIPSTPTNQWTPSPLAQTWSDTNWYPATWVLKRQATPTVNPRVASDTARPSPSTTCRLALVSRATASAPAAGRKTRTVR